MTKFPLSGLAAACSLALSLPLPACRAADNFPAPGTVGISVAKALEQLHYTRHQIDDGVSDRLLKLYVDTLDYNKLFFTQSDIDEFNEKYDHTLDDAIFNADIQPAYTIYDRYLKRVEDRVAKIKGALKGDKFDFDGHGSIELSRQKSPWPKNDADADRIWHDRIENELLTENLADQAAADKAAAEPKKDADAAKKDKDKEAPEARVAKRYDRLVRTLHEQTKEDETKYFLNSLALAYDPHSEYMSPSEMDNFAIQMRLSLIGIGAMLRKEDEYSKIMELVPGGPASVGGKLKVDDRITGVAQGSEPFEDVVDMKLDKVVEKIRGKKGSTVRLQVIPAGTTDTSKREVISIVRDEVKLTEGEARAEIIEKPNVAGGVDKLGWITLPGFYAEMDRVTRGGKAKSTTADVRRLIERLTKEGVAGLVMDLRRNGGGSLDEAIKLTGLFIKKGPVVQSKDYNQKTEVMSDTDPDIAYNGPLVVLTSHLSASASEIFAGALQDYGRATIVGDKNTFGKGTVQTIYEVGRLMSPFGFKQADAGALKLTISKFYRPSGQSTQLKGVESDIVLPSRYAHLELGEDALKYPLDYDTVAKADYEKWNGPQPDLDDLRAKSSARVKNDPEFRYLQQDIDRMESRIKENTLSLNKAEREKELASDKKRIEDIKAERLVRHVDKPVTYALALSDTDKPKLERVGADKKDKDKNKVAKADTADAKAQDPAAAEGGDADELDDAELNPREKSDAVDPIKTESLSIVEDIVEQTRHGKLATAASAPAKGKE